MDVILENYELAQVFWSQYASSKVISYFISNAALNFAKMMAHYSCGL